MIYNWQDLRILGIAMMPCSPLNDFCLWTDVPLQNAQQSLVLARQMQDLWCWNFCDWSQNYQADDKSRQSLNDEYKESPADHDSNEELHSNEIEVLKNWEYSLRYDNVGLTTRKRRVIICGFENCGKEFIKAWNFLDHFRMHQGVRPFEWDIWNKSFTQKGNLK